MLYQLRSDDRQGQERFLPLSRSRLGRAAEAVAVDYLVSRGFEVVDCNLRVGALEIDILARQGPLIVVVEVRTRGATSFTRALSSVDSVKRGRLVRAAEQVWRERFAGDKTAERLRFDVVAVLFDDKTTRVEHVVGAFTA